MARHVRVETDVSGPVSAELRGREVVLTVGTIRDASRLVVYLDPASARSLASQLDTAADTAEVTEVRA